MTIAVVNAGSGLAVRPRYFGVDTERKLRFSGNIGGGYLRAGDEVEVLLDLPPLETSAYEDSFTKGRTSFMCWCRDVEGGWHYWAPNGAHHSYPTGRLWWKKQPPVEVTSVFKAFFPDVQVPLSLSATTGQADP